MRAGEGLPEHAAKACASVFGAIDASATCCGIGDGADGVGTGVGSSLCAEGGMG